MNTKTREAVVLVSLYLDSAVNMYSTFSVTENVSDTVDTWVAYATNTSKFRLTRVKE